MIETIHNACISVINKIQIKFLFCFSAHFDILQNRLDGEARKVKFIMKIELLDFL